MPPPLNDTKRASILADIQARQLSRNAIARKHHVSPGTVSNIAKAAHVTDAFDRSKTENATRARVFDAKAARARLIEDLYGDAQRLRARAWEPYTQIVSGPAGPELVTTKLPPLRDQQAGYTALAICVDKALKLEAIDSDQGTEAGKTMIGDLRSALGLAYDALEAQEQAEAGADQGAGTGAEAAPQGG